MSTDSAAISFQPSHRTLSQRCSTSISWDDGKEIRIYHLGPGNVLHEYAYSESRGWEYGNLHDLKIVLDPTSSLAAVRSQGGSKRVYYQDPNDVIQGLYQLSEATKWRKYGASEKGVKGSSIAGLDWVDSNGLRHLSIFYQDPELRLREFSYDFSVHRWVSGNFSPGVQPRGTPISAEVVHGGNVDITVTWRDADGHTVSSSWSKSSGWDQLNRPNDGSQLLRGPANRTVSHLNFVGCINHPLTTVSWENGKEIRIYYIDSNRTLQEYAYSEKKGRDCWYHGDLFKLKIVLPLNSNSAIAAIRFDDEICIYYQDGLGIIQEICKPSLKNSWVKGAPLAEAAESSKISVIGWTNNGNHIRVYYQDPTLSLQERCYKNAHWIKGTFNPGPQPRGTPIFAEVSHVGYPAIQVLWKNANGRFVSSRCDQHSQWDTPTAEIVDSKGPDPSQLDGCG